MLDSSVAPGPLVAAQADSQPGGWLASPDPSRIFDLTVALASLVFLAPLLLVIALAIVLDGAGPVLYRQDRVGRNGRIFRILKFRTMTPGADAALASLLLRDPRAQAEWRQAYKLREDPRVTPVGAFLRKWSLDELPQFINVLRGEMSVVGPRPIVRGEASRYGRRFSAYCSVRPGITGLWQVMGRNDVSYRRRVAIDTHYARSKTIRLDLKILALTLPAVFGHKGCY